MSRKPVVFYIGDDAKGADTLAAHAARVAPYWSRFPNGWYWLESIYHDPVGPFGTKEAAETRAKEVS
jgi:hypothetical protein